MTKQALSVCVSGCIITAIACYWVNDRSGERETLGGRALTLTLLLFGALKLFSPSEPSLSSSWRHQRVIWQDGHAILEREVNSALTDE
jgi:hypothetical protein